jgi:hypothetical protein
MLFGVAVVGYLAAFTTAAAGTLFALLLAVGVIGELGFWATLITRWRTGARS